MDKQNWDYNLACEMECHTRSKKGLSWLNSWTFWIEKGGVWVRQGSLQFCEET